MSIVFTSQEALGATHHLQEAGNRALVAYWDSPQIGFHSDKVVRALSAACKALGITIDASGKVEKIIPEDAAKDARIMAEVG